MNRNEFLKLAAFSGLGLMIAFPVMGSSQETYTKLKKILENKTGRSLDKEYQAMLALKKEVLSFNPGNAKYSSLMDNYADEICAFLQSGNEEAERFFRYEAIDIQRFVNEVIMAGKNKIVLEEKDFDFVIAQIRKIAGLGMKYGSSDLQSDLAAIASGIDKLERRGYDRAMDLVSEKTGVVGRN